MNKQVDIVQTILDEIVASEATLFHDQYAEPHIAISGDGKNILKLNSRDFKQWLAKECYTKYKKTPSSDATNKVVLTLSGIASYERDEIKLQTRSAWENDHLWYDNGKEQPAILISPGRWNVTSKYPILFRRFGHQRSQVWPIKNEASNIKLLDQYINLQHDEMLLFITYLVAAFIPGFPHPLLLLHGPQGAGKSTPMRLLKELIDPSGIQALSQPSSMKEFTQQGHHHAFLFYDNLSTLPTWFSDALARASTGDGVSKRMLYSDDDDVFYKLQLPIGINAISQVILKPDLLDRSILLNLKRIPPHKRIPEKEFWAKFEDDKPAILGAIYETIAKALTITSDINLDKLPRMADFAKWGCAIAEAIGYTRQDFINAYQANINQQNNEALYASSVAQAIILLHKEFEEWESTPTELLHKLKGIAFANNLEQDRTWPKSPVWLTRRINEVEPNLRSIGINIEHSSTDNGRLISIQKLEDSTVDTVNSDISDQQNNVSKTVETVKAETQQQGLSL